MQRKNSKKTKLKFIQLDDTDSDDDVVTIDQKEEDKPTSLASDRSARLEQRRKRTKLSRRRKSDDLQVEEDDLQKALELSRMDMKRQAKMFEMFQHQEEVMKSKKDTWNGSPCNVNSQNVDGRGDKSERNEEIMTRKEKSGIQKVYRRRKRKAHLAKPYYPPTGINPRLYTSVITSMLEKYRVILKTEQSKLLRKIPFGKAVIPGYHLKCTLDVLRTNSPGNCDMCVPGASGTSDEEEEGTEDKFDDGTDHKGKIAEVIDVFDQVPESETDDHCKKVSRRIENQFELVDSADSDELQPLKIVGDRRGQNDGASQKSNQSVVAEPIIDLEDSSSSSKKSPSVNQILSSVGLEKSSTRKESSQAEINIEVIQSDDNLFENDDDDDDDETQVTTPSAIVVIPDDGKSRKKRSVSAKDDPSKNIPSPVFTEATTVDKCASLDSVEINFDYDKIKVLYEEARYAHYVRHNLIKENEQIITEDVKVTSEICKNPTENENIADAEIVSSDAAAAADDDDDDGRTSDSGDDHTLEMKLELEESVQEGTHCPLCGEFFPWSDIEVHAADCDGTVPEKTTRKERDTTKNHRFFSSQKLEQVDSNSLASVEPLPSTSTAAEKNRPSIASTSTNGRSAKESIVKEKTEKVNAKKRKLRVIVDSDSEEESPVSKIMKTHNINSQEDTEEDAMTDILNQGVIQVTKTKMTKRQQRHRIFQGRTQEDNVSTVCNNRDKESVDFEECFLCHKLVARSDYSQHVQAEIDEKHLFSENDSEVKIEDDSDIDKDAEHSTHGANMTVDDYEDDGDDDDDDAEDEEDGDESGTEVDWSQISDSPIKAFRGISLQKDSYIDYKNQFRDRPKSRRSTPRSVSSARGAVWSTSGRGGRGRGGSGRGRGKGKSWRRGRGRGKRSWKK